MIGIVVITHGKLADELISAVNFILAGETKTKMIGVSLDTTKIFDNFKEIIDSSIKKVDQGNGVLIVTDMFGGTPSNIGLTFLGSKKIEVISGVNLPMLLKLGTIDENITVEKAVRLAEKAGKDNIIIASKFLK